jgi:hypothetical protein
MRLVLEIATIASLVVVGYGDAADAQPPMGTPREARKEQTPGLSKKSLLGGQLGPWFAGDLAEDIQTPQVRLDASNTAFHLELFYQPHLTGILNLDCNVGAINRGDLRATSGGSSTFADVTLYPLSAGFILFPLAGNTSASFQPSIRAGGSLVVGTIQSEGENSQYYWVNYDSKTTWGYYIGAGANVVMSPSFSLTGTVKYQYAEFDENLFVNRDYSGVQVLIGAAYMYR